jgi:hypothetical protein
MRRIEGCLTTRNAVAFLAGLIVATILAPAALPAKVVKLEIKSREVVSLSPGHYGFGPYEIIKGVIYLEVDPNDPANEAIVDLQHARRNEHGMVEFSTEFELHKPVDANRSNHRLIYFVNNRGARLGTWHFNYQAREDWLCSQGYSYLWCGWDCDVLQRDDRLNINVPPATDNGHTITGKIYAEMISYEDDIVYSLPIVWGGSIAYPPLNMDKSDARLTMCQYRYQKPVEIPREEWDFARFEDGKIVPDSGTIYIKEGFKPGWLYDLVYVARNPKVTGLGLAAIRDVVTFFKYEKTDQYDNSNPVYGGVDYAYAWGHSQSGRLLNHFVYQNFNGDEKKRMVFDGVIANCPGAGKGLFNSRFAQFTRHGSHHEDNLFPIDFFPFATVEQNDPITGKTGDAFSRARDSGFMPRMMFINSSTDYWTRAASLLHTDVEGKTDIEIDGNVRIYAIAGLTHTDARIGVTGRALLTALDDWVSFGTKPPDSQIPRISDGTLVTLEEFKKNFPNIPDIRMPQSFYHPYRLDLGPRWETDGIADNAPPEIGKRYVCLVPQVDKDGNEIAGIRLPEIEAPLATYTGWSMRKPSFSNSLRRNEGAVWPLPRTAEERQKKADPRRSVLERYPTKKDYLFDVMKSLLVLKEKRLILGEDVEYLLQEAAEQNYWPVKDEEILVSIKEFSVLPTEVHRGDTVKFRVVTEGKAKDIFNFKMIWREAPRVQIKVTEDSTIEADNARTFMLEIGSGAPLGIFHFDLQAFDTNLNPVYLTGTLQNGGGELGSVTLTVK